MNNVSLGQKPLNGIKEVENRNFNYYRKRPHRHKRKNKTQDRRLAYWVLTLNNFNREYKTIAFSPRFPYGRVSKYSTNDLEFLGVVWDAKHLKLSLWL